MDQKTVNHQMQKVFISVNLVKNYCKMTQLFFKMRVIDYILMLCTYCSQYGQRSMQQSVRMIASPIQRCNIQRPCNIELRTNNLILINVFHIILCFSYIPVLMFVFNKEDSEKINYNFLKVPEDTLSMLTM